jgi:lipoate-protein ligase B
MSGHGLRRSYLVSLTILAVLAFVLGVIYLDPGTGKTQTAEPIKAAPSGIPSDEPVARVASVLSPSVVQINVTGVQQTPYGAQKEEGIGSGVIYRSDGYIVTNNHVVEGAHNVEVAFADGSTEQGQVVGTDPTTDIAVVKVDRGGQVTYHGPGQLVAYLLFDLKRARRGIREMVRRIETAVVAWLAAAGVDAHGKPSAPGVYVTRDGVEAKIAALGLKVRNGCTYHGVAVNIDMDLSPFDDIDPCGYPGLRVVQLADFGVRRSVTEAGRELAPELARHLA